ncbi:MAG TPA: hypothetical protein VMV10_19570 [Pirellulales bacterium]|nr:hypothetical protein [Pirellulales bacterium]
MWFRPTRCFKAVATSLVLAVIGGVEYTLADCPDRGVQPSSPCITLQSVCTSGPGCASTTQQKEKYGNFQSVYSEGLFTAFAAKADCYTECSCYVPDNGGCQPTTFCQTYTANTLTALGCGIGS